MIASEVARLLHAKKFGKGWRARCPIHRSRRDTLSIKQGERWVLITCFAGCQVEELLPHWGLRMQDLALESTITPQVRARTSLQDRRENLERRLGLVIWLGALDSDWAHVEKRIRGELQLLRCHIEPLKLIQEQRGEQWKSMTQGQRDRYLEGVWERLQSQ